MFSVVYAEIWTAYPVLYPRVINMWASLETTYTDALWPSSSLHNITHDWGPCQSNRCAKFHPPALWASFHLTALPPLFVFYWFPSYLHTSACIFCCCFWLFWLSAGENWVHMGLVSGQLQHRQTVCVCVCVGDRAWRYKTSELITELRQPEDKQLCSLRLRIQTSQSRLLQVT